MAHIIVLGRNYSSSLGALRSLGKAGHCVELIYIAFRKDGNVVSCCKYLSGYAEVSQESQVLDAIRAKASPEKAVLFPTDDHTAELIDRNRVELSENFILPFMDNGDLDRQIEYYMDKTVQQEIARAYGLKTAKTWIVDLTLVGTLIPEDMVYPCFVKPLVSANGGKGDIGRCDSPEALQNKLSALQARGRESVMIQEYLDIVQEYVINGVCQNQTVLIPGVIRKTKVAKNNKGVTLSGVLEANDTLPCGVLESVVKVMQAFHYTGAFDFELNMVGGELYFGEVNFRIGGPNYIYTLCGANIPDLTVRALQGEVIGMPEAVVLGKSFVNDKVLWEDYLAHFITWKEVQRCRQSVDYSLTTDQDDPLPGKRFYRDTRVKCGKYWVRNLIGKAR